MLVTIPVVLISMAVSVLAAYALSRLGFAGAGILISLHLPSLPKGEGRRGRLLELAGS